MGSVCVAQAMGSSVFMQSGRFTGFSDDPLHATLRVGDDLSVGTIAIEEPMGRMVGMNISLEPSGQVFAQGNVAVFAAWAAPAFP